MLQGGSAAPAAGLAAPSGAAIAEAPSEGPAACESFREVYDKPRKTARSEAADVAYWRHDQEGHEAGEGEGTKA
jgi:hypothetical protein